MIQGPSSSNNDPTFHPIEEKSQQNRKEDPVSQLGRGQLEASGNELRTSGEAPLSKRLSLKERIISLFSKGKKESDSPEPNTLARTKSSEVFKNLSVRNMLGNRGGGQSVNQQPTPISGHGGGAEAPVEQRPKGSEDAKIEKRSDQNYVTHREAMESYISKSSGPGLTASDSMDIKKAIAILENFLDKAAQQGVRIVGSNPNEMVRSAIDDIAILRSLVQPDAIELPNCLREEKCFNAVSMHFVNIGSKFGLEELELIREGEQLCHEISEGRAQEIPANSDAAVKIAWFLKSQSILMGQGSEKEMYSVVGREVFDFLMRCGNEGNIVPTERKSQQAPLSQEDHPPIQLFNKQTGKFYHRSSSHFGSSVAKLSAQTPKGVKEVKALFGLDVSGLWGGKETLHFGLREVTLPNGEKQQVSFIKPEPHGCAPFWKKGFLSGKNIHDFVHHSLGFTTTLKKSLGITKWELNTQTEKFDAKGLGKRINTAFTDAMNSQVAAAGLSGAEAAEIQSVTAAAIKQINIGAKGGTAKLSEAMDNLEARAENEVDPHIQAMLQGALSTLEPYRRFLREKMAIDEERGIQPSIRSNNEYLHNLSAPILDSTYLEASTYQAVRVGGELSFTATRLAV